MSEPTDLGVPPAPKVPATTAHYREPDSSFINPAALSGRRQAGVWIYVSALLLAAAADFSNFYQIIQYAMPSTKSALLLLLVLGVTGSVLFLAHISGVLTRTRAAHRAAPAPRTFIVLAMLAWIGLGLGGLYVRLTYVDNAVPAQAPVVANQPTATAPTATPAVQAETPDTLQPEEKTAAAVLFTALYVGTGVVALVGGYLTHDPLRAALRGARRAHEQAVEEAAASARDFVLAQGAVTLEGMRINTERVRAVQRDAQVQAAEVELKRHVRAQIEAGLQDPTITDAYTHLDEPD